jgi:hypothetical protein
MKNTEGNIIEVQPTTIRKLDRKIIKEAIDKAENGDTIHFGTILKKDVDWQDALLTVLDNIFECKFPHRNPRKVIKTKRKLTLIEKRDLALKAWRKHLKNIDSRPGFDLRS